MELARASSVESDLQVSAASLVTTTTRPIVVRTASIDKLSNVLGERVTEIGSVVNVTNTTPQSTKVTNGIFVGVLMFLVGVSCSAAFYEFSKNTCYNTTM